MKQKYKYKSGVRDAENKPFVPSKSLFSGSQFYK